MEEKKEIWKLLELLNEFEEETKSWYTWKDIDSYDNCVYWVDCDGETEIVMYSDLYSKSYGFIWWLVENDKIDRDKCECKQLYYYLKKSENMHWDKNFSRCERLLMLLAISDTPIDLLISILK